MILREWNKKNLNQGSFCFVETSLLVLALKGAATGNWSQVTKYICSSLTPNLLSTFDPSSLVAKRHRCAFQFPDASDTNHLLSRPQRKNPQKGILLVGDVVEDVRTAFERLGDASIYIPLFQT